MKQKIKWTGLFFSTALLLCSCNNDKEKIKPGDAPKARPTPKVNVLVVGTSPLSDNLELPGTILPNESTDIHPEISGRLTYLNVAEGRSVGKGALIAKIYDGDLQAQLNKLKIQLQTARQTAKRYEELVKIDGVSRQEYDLQMLNINTILADMNIVQSNLQRTLIRAPFYGTLGLKNISPGSYVTPASVVATIRQDNQLKLDFTLPEKYASKIQIGQLIDFATNKGDKIYTAKVLASEMSISEVNRALQVRAIVLKNDGGLMPGEFVKVKTKFDPDPNAILIPSQAIIPTAIGKQVAVYTNGVADLRNVETGLRDSTNVQIVSGIKVGDTIIVSGIMSLKQGSKVSIDKASK